MVSYYNTLPYTQKHSAANLAYPASQWPQWPANYHTPPNPQFLGEMESSHAHHQMYYNPHMFHTPTSEWHSPTSSAENYSPQNVPNAHQMLQHQHANNLIGAGVGGGGVGISGIGGPGSGNGNGNIIGNNGSSSTGSSGSSSASAGPGSGNTQLNETASSIGEHHIAEGLPSPPITVSGSEISSPGAPTSSSSPHHVSHLLHNNNNNSPSTNNNNNNNNSTHNNNNNRQSSPVKSHYYDWMKKPSYPAQPTPGKTRTKDKYRVVYTDFQRLELEKEYCTSRYITIRRKTELAQTLSLSERQVKIWFQNRRAKERKQNKKGNDPTALSIQQQHHDYPNMMDTKPKLEPGLHLQHSMSSLHSMSSMAAMSMPAALGLHHHHHHLHGHHHSLAMSAHTSAAHHQSLHQSPHTHSHTHSQMSAAAAVAAASVGSLPM